MNDQNALPTLDDWQRSQRPRDVLRFAPVVPLSTAGGCCITTLCLWPVLTAPWWPAWLAAGFALALVQWRARRLIRGASVASIGARGTLERRRWTLVNGVVAGHRYAIYRDFHNGLPLVHVGEAVVMSAGEQTSKVVVTTTRDSIEPGDVAVPRRQPN